MDLVTMAGFGRAVRHRKHLPAHLVLSGRRLHLSFSTESTPAFPQAPPNLSWVFCFSIKCQPLIPSPIHSSMH